MADIPPSDPLQSLEPSLNTAPAPLTHHTAAPNLSPMVGSLINAFAEDPILSHGGTGYNVSRTVSLLAFIFEKARNAVEFRAEHLIRRAAIERILKRRIMLSGSAGSIASNLITELLWARYIDSSLLDEAKENELSMIIDKYLMVKQAINAGHAGISWNFVLGIASSEIDEAIMPAEKRQALLYFFYQAMRAKITLPGIDEQQTNLITLVACERSFMKSDDALIAFHLIKLMKPNWTKNDAVIENKDVLEFATLAASVKSVLGHASIPPIFRYLRKQMPPYLLLRDFFLETDGKAKAIIDEPEKFEEKLVELAQRRYNETGKKVRTAVIRSFIYIFLTKMVFALALETPYDIYIAKRLAVLPLLINTIFPPIMLFLVAGLFSVPGADNTKRLIDRIKKIIYHFDDLTREQDTLVSKQRIKRPVLTAGFSFIYLATFGITFGLINWILTMLEFSIVSKIIFVFFVALVSFFAYRIRQSAKEYEVIDRQGFLEPLVDFFLLPVLQAGQFLSQEIAKINIFIFLFDFILEAPLKTIFEVVEEWIRFVRIKKDEIV